MSSPTIDIRERRAVPRGGQRPAAQTSPGREVDDATLPTISIVTISRNQGAFLDECIRSVAGQDYPALDYVVVDAGSSDGSRETIAYAASVIDEIICEPDGGPADGLNKGFALARGDVFGYLNADDRLRPGALRRVGEYFAAHPDVDVLCGAIRLIDAHGRAAPRARTADRFDLARYAAGVCTVGQQATFFRRRAFEAAGGFRVANRISWDGELLVDMALSGARFATLPKVLADFRLHGAGITGSGRWHRLALTEHRRLSAKIASHGVALYPPSLLPLVRTAYRCNPMRHLRYLLAR
jgi:glycosyltransferase involved in cell wall biosynthesis